MPTYVLEGGSSALLPAKPLTLRIQGAGQGEVRLEALRNGAPDPHAITPMTGMLVLPRVTEPIEVRVVPVRESTFPSGTVVALSAAIELHGDLDPERAVMQGIDLSGLARRELLRVESAGDQLKLTAMGVIVDSPLPPLAARARDVARELLGVERVPAAEAIGLRMRVDASASMRPLVTEGAVGAALEVLVGVSRVTSHDHPVSAELGTDRAAVVTSDSVGDLPRAVHEALGQLPLRTGFRSRGSGNQGAQTALCVVSDGVPADLGGDRTALVVLVTPSAEAVLAPRAPRTTAWLPLPEWGATSTYQQLMEGEDALRRAVAAVLQSVLPPDSTLQKQLAGAGVPLDAEATQIRASY